MTDATTKPYFIRALHEWCTDFGYTPYLVVAVGPQVRVPLAYVQDGQITLNISFEATNQLVLGNDYIEFQARFGGKTELISIPVGAVAAIFARETNTGMGFETVMVEETDDVDVSISEGSAKQDDDDSSSKPPHLKVIK